MSDVYDAADRLVSRFEDDDEVAYAEVGAVEQSGFDVVARDGRARCNDLSSTGVWFRVFTGGAADYRYTTVLDRENLDDLAERAIRSGRNLGQDVPSAFDAASFTRGIHDGWAPSDRLEAVDPEDAGARLEAARDSALEGIDLERSRLELQGTQLDHALLTTTGSVVRTSLDRIGLDATVAPRDGPKIREHAGATTGTRFLDRLDEVFEAIADRARRAAAADVAPNSGGTTAGPKRRDVVLGPFAAGDVLHYVSHFLERDTAYLGADPFSEGEEIAPPSLTIDDVIRPGSWSARAYDAEITPTRPVSLVEDGVVRNLMDSVASAVEEGTVPQGHAVAAIGFEQPPRIHARHLDVEQGSAPRADLLDGAALSIERLGEGRYLNEATRTKRSSGFPSTVLYAKDVDEQTPGEFDEGTDQRIEFPIREGYLVEDGARAERLDGASLEFAISDLRSIEALGTERRTLTGVCEKHKSHLPYAVTAPAVRLETNVVR